MMKFNEDAIREAAYYIWQNNGCPANTSLQDWNAAINQLNALYGAKKTTLSSSKVSTLSNGYKKTSSCKTSAAVKKSPAKKVAKKSK